MRSPRSFYLAILFSSLTGLHLFVPGPLSAQSYEQGILSKKPVGYWRLGEKKGSSARDSSKYGHHGRYFGTPSLQEPGAIAKNKNTAVELNGKKSYIEIPADRAFSQPTSGKGLTVEVWLRPDRLEFPGATDDPYIMWLGKGEPNQQEWAFRLYSRTSKDRPNRISAYLFNPNGGLGAGAYFQDKLRAGEWMHIVACFDPGNAHTRGAGVHLYKNGIQRMAPPSPGALYNNPKWKIHPASGSAPLRLGTRDGKHYLAGALDEVAIYPRVLSAKEIMANYKLGRGK